MQITLTLICIGVLLTGCRTKTDVQRTPVTVSFKSEYFSFVHPTFVVPVKASLGGGQDQTVLTTPAGAQVILQEYNSVNSSGLTKRMMDALLRATPMDEGIEARSREPAQKTLRSGKILSGEKVTLKFADGEDVRQLLSYAVGDKGVLVMTIIDVKIPAKDLKIIELFWKTLKINCERKPSESPIEPAL